MSLATIVVALKAQPLRRVRLAGDR